MELNLQEIRGKLDTIDSQMIGLFCQRMNLVKDVAAYKQEHNLPILDTGREQGILHRVSLLAGEEMSGYAQRLFETLMMLSREYQEKQMQSSGKKA